MFRPGQIVDEAIERVKGVTIGHAPRPIVSRPRPKALPLLAVATLLFASLYFISILQSIPRVLTDTESRSETLLYVGFLAALFYLYTAQMVTTFRLSSGNRRAWRNMCRLSLIYIFFSIISLIGGRETVWLAQTLEVSAYLVVAVMTLMLFYLLRSPVREFFTPPYAEKAPLRRWLLFIFGQDPYQERYLRLI
ncbi:MAG: hypothetical protein PWQ88_498 [Candidatus Methanomethylophilaceae archaeon]|nr:hypothetical protein [Candidatus Methanomethylophilaceae archaeon]MDI3541432.1 hypothetical protein [Candidatus Methanomethylophilaceae archaeon]HIJ00597.1 hypothetical protein [Candidatus Methanomethylophilaceae archaeon]